MNKYLSGIYGDKLTEFMMIDECKYLNTCNDVSMKKGYLQTLIEFLTQLRYLHLSKLDRSVILNKPEWLKISIFIVKKLLN